MKLQIKGVIFLILLTASLSCTNDSQEIKYETPCDELDAVDLEMNETLSAVEEKFKQEKIFLAKLKNAQIKWIQYKDRHVDALFPKKQSFYEKNYKEDYNQCKCREWARLTKLRTEELKSWLKEGSDNDCPSSLP